MSIYAGSYPEAFEEVTVLKLPLFIKVEFSPLFQLKRNHFTATIMFPHNTLMKYDTAVFTSLKSYTWQ